MPTEQGRSILMGHWLGRIGGQSFTPEWAFSWGLWSHCASQAGSSPNNWQWNKSPWDPACITESYLIWISFGDAVIFFLCQRSILKSRSTYDLKLDAKQVESTWCKYDTFQTWGTQCADTTWSFIWFAMPTPSEATSGPRLSWQNLQWWTSCLSAWKCSACDGWGVQAFVGCCCLTHPFMFGAIISFSVQGTSSLQDPLKA